MRLPDVASRLRELASSHGIAELGALADEIGRRPSSRGPATSRRMTAALAAQIRTYARTHPNETQLEIARRFGVNQGRVSETLRGKRV